MPTKPIQFLLDRSFSAEHLKSQISISSPFLIEIVNFSTHAFIKAQESMEKEPNTNFALFSFYLKMIELADGIEVLLGKSCISPAIPLLRIMFELNTYIHYLLSNHYKHRSLAWLYVSFTEELKVARNFDVGTEEWKKFEISKENDLYAKNTDFSRVSSRARKILNLQTSFLNDKQMQPIRTEFTRVKEFYKFKEDSKIKWYSLFPDDPNKKEPNSFFQLCRLLKKEAIYKLLYNPWSSSLHDADYKIFLKRLKINLQIERVIRNPDEFNTVVFYASTFLLDTIRSTADYFHANVNISKWYVKEVEKSYLYFTKELEKENLLS
jgi:hypothetical protein